MNQADAKIFNLDELCGLSGLSKRTIRYYMQIGLVARPEGETRAARYFTRHLEQLLQIRKWSEAGLSLERIGELLGGADGACPARARQAGTIEVWSHLVVADGVEVTLEPGRAGLTPEQVREFFASVLSAYAKIQTGEK